MQYDDDDDDEDDDNDDDEVDDDDDDDVDDDDDDYFRGHREEGCLGQTEGDHAANSRPGNKVRYGTTQN